MCDLCGFRSQSRAPVAMSANSKSAGSTGRRAAAAAAAAAEREAREAREARELRAQARAGLKEEIHLQAKQLEVEFGMDSFSEGEESDASIQLISDGWSPVHIRKDLPLPAGIRSWGQWCNTMISLPKYQKMGWSFGDIANRGRSEKEVRKYLLWIEKTYGTNQAQETELVNGQLRLVHQVRNQATDLALFLLAMDFQGELESADLSEGAGYVRTFKQGA